MFNADYQRRWLDSLQPEDPSKPDGQQYGYGIAQLRLGPNALYFHGGEMPGYNSFMGYDPANRVTLVVWTNLTVSPDGKPTANSPHAESARSDLRGVPAATSADLNASLNIRGQARSEPAAVSRPCDRRAHGIRIPIGPPSGFGSACVWP